ncbi:DMT family transporter [Paenibacillus eucommiae]|uniref:Drug/metabolite transporter (DMT)-like permease n=1 Tax=Paenibacillus eucommiae TaxID=1355755 RepID=A0ABS4J3H3_9BACL|nr:DMT family transporter [Paenibacillus eucommiae]MBP1993835.1 drug/metabolite transporter (DMT)-like permease [Paenibacillus eucommiae]
MKALMTILCLVWGFNFIIMKLGNGVVPPVMFAALRFLTGAVVLLGVCAALKIPMPNKSEWKWYVLCGLLQTTYFNIAIQISLNYISAGLTSMLTYSMPLFLSIMAHKWIPGEQLTLKKMLGIGLGLLGLCMSMNIGLEGSSWAILLALSSAISWAAANVLFKVKLKNSDTLSYTTWQMVIGAVGLLMVSFFFESGEMQWGVMPVVYILFAGVVASAFAFMLWNHVLSHVEASKASISLLMVPIVGVISGCLFLNEALEWMTLVGMLFVLAGIWLVNRKGTRESPVTRM